jgi:putative phosphoserine phosphatase/1-acylglycerol-3-phosphate O-acyltransferase
MKQNIQSIINHTKFQEKLQLIADKHNIDFSEVQRKGADCISELYSQQHPVANMLSIKGFQFMMSKAYNNKIDIDPKEIKKVNEINATKLCCIYFNSQNILR